MWRIRAKIANGFYKLAMRIYPHLEADKSLARQLDKPTVVNTSRDMWPEETIRKGYGKS